MDINATNPVDNQIQGLGSTTKVNEIKEEEEKSTGQQTKQAEDNPDYRVSLSEMAKQDIAALANPKGTDPLATENGLTEEEAADLAQHTAQQLSQTNVAIANQAMQKAVDLFS